MIGCGPRLRHEGTKVASLSNVTLRVDGMKKVNGFVWLSWPDAIVKALEELKGIKNAEYKIEAEEFHVAYDGKHIALPQIIEAIREDGKQRGFAYEPQVVTKTWFQNLLIPFSVEFEPIVILNEVKDLTARDSSADLRMTEKAHFQVKMVLVVLIDIIIPESEDGKAVRDGGILLLKQLRENPKYKNLPVREIFVTALANEGNIDEISREYKIPVVPKPLDMKQFIRAVEKVSQS